MSVAKEILEKISFKNLFWSVAFIIIAFAIWYIISKFRAKGYAYVETTKKDVVRRKAIITTLSNGLKFILVIFTLLAVLQVNGINVASVAAGLGIAGAVVAVAVQDVFKDVVQGLRLFTDGFFSVGDCVKYNGESYQVVEYTLRTTKMKSLVDNSVLSISNRNITEVSKLSGTVIIKIPLSYDVSPEKADEVLSECVKEIDKVKGISKCKYHGLNTFEESSILYLITFNTRPIDCYAMRRTAMRIIKDNLDKAGLSIPYNQLDIHNV